MPAPTGVQAEPVAHTNRIISMQALPSGKLLVTWSEDKTVKLWTLPTGDLSKTLLEHSEQVQRVAVSPNEKYLATADAGGTVIIWSLPDGAKLGSIKCDDQLDDLHVNDQGDKVFTRRQRGLNIWNTRDGKLERQFTLSGGIDLHAFAEGAKGTYFVSASSPRSIEIISMADERQQRVIRDIPRSRFCVSPDGTLLATACSDGSLRVYTLPEAALLASTQLKPNVSGLRFRGNDTVETLVATGTVGYEARLYRVDPGWKLVREVEAHANAIVDFAVSEDRVYAATVSKDRSIKIWKVADWTLFRELADLSTACFSVAFQKDNSRLLAGCRDGRIRMWRIGGAENAADGEYDGHAGGVTQITVQGNFVWTCGRDEKVKMWEFQNGGSTFHPVRAFSGQSSQLYSVAVAGSEVATGSLEGSVRVWTKRGDLRRTLPGNGGIVYSVAMPFLGEFVVSGGDDKLVRLWSTSDTNPATFAGHTKTIYSVVINETKSRIASCGSDGSVRIWDIASGGELHAMQTDTALFDVRFLSDHEVAASGADGRIRIWNVPSLAEDGIEEITDGDDVDGAIFVIVEKHKIVVVAREKQIAIHTIGTAGRQKTLTDVVATNEVEQRRRVEETQETVRQKAMAVETKSKGEEKARETTITVPAYSPPAYSPPTYSPRTYGTHYWRPN